MPQLQGNNPANDPDRKPVKGRSKFKPNRSLYQTFKFGINQPHLAMEVVEGDKVSIRSASDVDTYNLKAPLMTPVKMQKDYFFAPLRAILPHNADLLITNPLSGDDIEAAYVNAGLDWYDLESKLNVLCQRIRPLIASINDANQTAQVRAYGAVESLLAVVALIEPFCSEGSLLNYCGFNLSTIMNFGVRSGYEDIFCDEFVEALADHINKYVKSFQIKLLDSVDPDSIAITASTNVVVDTEISSEEMTSARWSLRYFLEQVRQGTVVYSCDTLVLKTANTFPALKYTDPSTGSQSDYDITYYSGWIPAGISQAGERILNLSRLVAYQLSSAQFYTDDAVDYVYSTSLWHSNMLALLAMAKTGNGTYSIPYYVLNGIRHEYDSVSAYCFSDVLSTLSSANTSLYNNTPTANGFNLLPNMTYNPYIIQAFGAYGYLVNYMGFTRSLKFRDYFCGSRPHPLAVGDVSVTVASNQFSVVDVTKNIQMQRFLNQVNRVGRTFKEYVQGIFGVTPTRDPRDCVYLGSSVDMIGAEETEMTSENIQSKANTISSKLRKNSSQFAFEGSFSEPGIVIGIVHFDVTRPYVLANDRCMLHTDRFDMFNPYLQQIGDQEVDRVELDLFAAGVDNFAYKLRYSEYKQSFDRAVGGFHHFLPGYAFLNLRANYCTPDGVVKISPDFIRARSVEFDKFYAVMQNFSLAGYFHFIVRNDLTIDADRPMEAAPSIL